MNLQDLITKIMEHNPLDFGNIFSRSIELFKKVWLQGFLTLLLTFALTLPFYILFYIPLISAGITDPEMLKSEEISPALAIAMAILFPVLLLGIMTISTALNAAFLRICHLKDMGSTEADDYFFYLKNGRWKKSLVLGLFVFGLSAMGMLLCGIGLFYVIVPISLMPAFFAFNEELSPTEIVKASFQLGNKNWLVIFGLLIVMGLVAQLGILLCGIGILFTAMLAKIPVYYIYKDGVGFSKDV